MSPAQKFRKGIFSGAAPVVTITAPALNTGSPLSSYTIAGSGSPKVATFSAAATAIDDFGGDVSAKLIWTSSIDGQVGTGASPSIVLSSGTHTLTASASDVGGATGSDTITVVVS